MNQETPLRRGFLNLSIPLPTPPRREHVGYALCPIVRQSSVNQLLPTICHSETQKPSERSKGAARILQLAKSLLVTCTLSFPETHPYLNLMCQQNREVRAGVSI